MAETAERLMRSRYTAFATGDTAHLLASWHPSTRPARLDLDAGRTWLRLEVVEVEAGGLLDATGTVAFRAHSRVSGVHDVLSERSRFVRDAGSWRYLDGQPGA